MKLVVSASISLLLLIAIASCKKESFITSEFARVTTSADTLTYDTVFVTSGSITKSFKIFNDNNQKLKLSRVKLMGGNASAYKMNVDGVSSAEVNNIEIEANDSIYVFVQVNVNQGASNLPFLVRDSILISYNNNNRYVQLQAYGQNANFMRNVRITGNTTWTNNLPYVILGSVVVDTTASLTINPGCRIYVNGTAPFIIDGRLNAVGTKRDSIVFRSDRLDPDYKDFPAGWPGIVFRGRSRDNVMRFCNVLNAYQALVLDGMPPNANPKLTISQSIIDNAFDAGILAVNSSIAADNCLISNCGANVMLLLGGNYNFTHCTSASYSTTFFSHTNPAFLMTDYVVQGNSFVTRPLTATLRNNIMWGDFGNVEDELSILKQGPSSSFIVTLENNLFKAVRDPANITAQSGNIKNQPVQFDSINTSRRIFDFHLRRYPSPAINAGKPTTFTRDLDDRPRPVGLPDIGCYERQ
jgi:hypothetical protein